MLRLGLVAVSFVLVAGSAFAQCSPSPPYPPICDLANPNYDPETTGSGYQPPICFPLSYGSAVTQIRAAFDCAPPRVQQDLRTLSAIFILPYNYWKGADKSFGMWENPADQGNARRSYVFLSPTAFGRNVAQIESQTQNDVLAGTNNKLRVTYTAAPDTTALGLLSVIAHEAAHAKWYRDKVATNAAKGPCFRNLVGTYWTGVPDRRWVEFAASGGADHKPGSGTTHPNRGLNEAQLHALHRRFASILAAVSPEEDFVETYKLSTLAPRLNDLSVWTQNRVSDVLVSMKAGRLKTKVACVSYFLPH
jgi:hypothetical protein